MALAHRSARAELLLAAYEIQFAFLTAPRRSSVPLLLAAPFHPLISVGARELRRAMAFLVISDALVSFSLVEK